MYILKIPNNNDIVNEIKEYYIHNLYYFFDLHDIANNTSKEPEINNIDILMSMIIITKVLIYRKKLSKLKCSI